MMASHTNGIHRTRSHRLRVLHSGCRQASWAMMTRQARRSSAIQHDTVRCGFLSRRSYVAPSRRSRGSAKRPRKELTYCPIYGFKPCVICAKDLTPALFCGAARLWEGLQPRQAFAACCFRCALRWPVARQITTALVMPLAASLLVRIDPDQCAIFALCLAATRLQFTSIRTISARLTPRPGVYGSALRAGAEITLNEDVSCSV